jgi:hypothetical protein
MVAHTIRREEKTDTAMNKYRPVQMTRVETPKPSSVPNAVNESAEIGPDENVDNTCAISVLEAVTYSAVIRPEESADNVCNIRCARRGVLICRKRT